MEDDDGYTYGKLIVVKKNGTDGGVCRMQTTELLIGRYRRAGGVYSFALCDRTADVVCVRAGAQGR